MDDRKVRLRSESRIQLIVRGSTVKVQVIVVDEMVDDVDVVVGMHLIVMVGKKGVEFSNRCVARSEY